MDTLYPTELLRLAASAELRGRLVVADGTQDGRSVVCGSTITLDVAMNGPLIAAIGFDLDACALGRASAEVMARDVVGKSVEDARAVAAALAAYLAGQGDTALPEGLQPLAQLRGYPARHGSVLMPWRTLVRAVERLQEAGL
jgi:NifU-like protein involved in Fe-S cluster formation